MSEFFCHSVLRVYLRLFVCTCRIGGLEKESQVACAWFSRGEFVI